MNSLGYSKMALPWLYICKIYTVNREQQRFFVDNLTVRCNLLTFRLDARGKSAPQRIFVVFYTATATENNVTSYTINGSFKIQNLLYSTCVCSVTGFHQGSVSMYSLSALDHQQKETGGRGAPPRMEKRSESYDPLSFSDEPFPSAG